MNQKKGQEAKDVATIYYDLFIEVISGGSFGIRMNTLAEAPRLRLLSPSCVNVEGRGRRSRSTTTSGPGVVCSVREGDTDGDVRGRLPFGRRRLLEFCLERVRVVPASGGRPACVDIDMDEDEDACACVDESVERGCNESSGGVSARCRRGIGKGGVRGGDMGWTSRLSRDDEGRGSMLRELRER